MIQGGQAGLLLIFVFLKLLTFNSANLFWYRVGKTAIISQFLYDQFCSEYKPTVMTLSGRISYYAGDNVEKNMLQPLSGLKQKVS